MHRHVTALALCTVGACSSGSPAPVPNTAAMPTGETVRVSSETVGTIALSSNTDVNEVKSSVAAAPRTVFEALTDVYRTLGIPVTAVDSKNLALGNTGANLRHRLGKTMLSRYLDCGRTQTAPNADTYDIYLSVITRVKDDGAGGSRLGTVVQALARPMTNSGNYSRCESLGRLEDEIVRATKERVAR